MKARLPTIVPAAPLLALLLAACAAAPTTDVPEPGTGIEVEGIVIRNSLSYEVRDVTVEAPASGRFVSCGTILARTECRTSFQAIDYRANALRVRWKERGEPNSTDAFKVELPAGVEPGDTVWLEVIIYAPGLAGARIYQP